MISGEKPKVNQVVFVEFVSVIYTFKVYVSVVVVFKVIVLVVLVLVVCILAIDHHVEWSCIWWP